MSFLYNEYVASIIFGLIAVMLVYIWADKVMLFLKEKSLGKKDEVVKYMRLMSIEVDDKKLTLTMLSLSFGLGALMFFLFWPNVVLSLMIGSLVTVLGWSLPLLLVKTTYERRCSKFVDQMVDGLTIMANGIKSGSNATQSMEKVVDIMENPISQEFKTVLNAVQFGQSLEEALNDLAERIPRPDVQMFVTAINILKETGGNLGETFQTIVLVVRERQKVEKKIQAMTAQGIAQGFIVSSIPAILAIVFYVVDPKFIAPMFNTTLGIILLLVMVSLQIIGGLLIRKVVTIKV